MSLSLHLLAGYSSGTAGNCMANGGSVGSGGHPRWEVLRVPRLHLTLLRGKPPPCYVGSMNPGDVPRFRPSLHTPTAALNDLSRLVAPLAGLQVRPPMSLRQTPAGYVLEYDGKQIAETVIVRIPDPADTDAEGLVTGVFIQDFTGLPVTNSDGEEVLLYLVGGT